MPNTEEGAPKATDDPGALQAGAPAAPAPTPDVTAGGAGTDGAPADPKPTPNTDSTDQPGQQVGASPPTEGGAPAAEAGAGTQGDGEGIGSQLAGGNLNVPPPEGMATFQQAGITLSLEITDIHGNGCDVRQADGTALFRPFQNSMRDDYDPKPGDWWIIYSSGHEAISPKSAFAQGYVPMPPPAG